MNDSDVTLAGSNPATIVNEVDGQLSIGPSPVNSAPEVSVGPDSGTAPAADRDLLDRLDQLDATLEGLRQELAAAHARAAARERVIDRLHEDNQRLRAGERQQLLRPLLVDLQRLRSDLLRQAAGLPADMSVDQTVALLESFACSVELTLGRCGVEVVRPEIGAPFDPRQQRAAGVTAAPGPELDGVVAEVLSDGYLDTMTDRVLAAAAVRVQRWSPPRTEAEETQDGRSLESSVESGHISSDIPASAG